MYAMKSSDLGRSVFKILLGASPEEDEMSKQELVLQSISSTFAGETSVDQMLGMVAFVVLLAGLIAYGAYYNWKQSHRAPFDRLHE
jgi:hypothetical protein